MSLRLRPRASVTLADDTSIFEQLKPYIEKLLLSPQGIGLVAIGVGVLLRLTHLKDIVLIGPLQGTDQSLEAHTRHRYGLDQVVFMVDLTAVSSWVQGVTNAVGAVAQSFNGVNPFFGLLGSHLMNAEPLPNGKVPVLLSDVLIICGAGVFLGGSVSSVLSAVPKV